MSATQALPSWVMEDLAAWAAVDLPAYKQRREHPLLSHAKLVLVWIAARYPIAHWHELRVSMVQAWLAAHPNLKPSTLHSYVKAVRKWLRWHERDEIDKPILSARLQGVCPQARLDDPFVVDEDTWQRILQRAHWVYAGSTGLRCTLGGRRRVAFMGDWQRGGFVLWLTLGAELGLRPWELAFLRRDELHLDTRNGRVPHIRLLDHEARNRKTVFAGTRLQLSADLVDALCRYLARLDGDYLFARPSDRSPSGWRAPNYDQIWKALREEFDLPVNGRIIRRRHATCTAARNPNLFEVSKATRHARLDTLRHYLQRTGGAVVDPKTGKLVGES